jgi:ketoreductase RED2
VSQESDAKGLVAAGLERWGRLDILVNNAARTHLIPHVDLDSVTDEVWQEILGVNLLGTWYTTRAAVQPLQESDDGCVINVTSIAGLSQTGSSIPYAVSKAAVNHLTRLLANVLAPKIRVNAVAPGLVDTPWTKDWHGPRENWKRVTPLQRTGQPDEIAHACLFLAEAHNLTGQIIVSDSGMTLRPPS